MIGTTDFPFLREKAISSDNIANVGHIASCREITDLNYLLPIGSLGHSDSLCQSGDNKIGTLSRAAVIKGTDDHNRQIIVLDINVSQIFGCRFGLSIRRYRIKRPMGGKGQLFWLHRTVNVGGAGKQQLLELLLSPNRLKQIMGADSVYLKGFVRRSKRLFYGGNGSQMKNVIWARFDQKSTASLRIGDIKVVDFYPGANLGEVAIAFIRSIGTLNLITASQEFLGQP